MCAQRRGHSETSTSQQESFHQKSTLPDLDVGLPASRTLGRSVSAAHAASPVAFGHGSLLSLYIAPYILLWNTNLVWWNGFLKKGFECPSTTPVGLLLSIPFSRSARGVLGLQLCSQLSYGFSPGRPQAGLDPPVLLRRSRETSGPSHGPQRDTHRCGVGEGSLGLGGFPYLVATGSS